MSRTTAVRSLSRDRKNSKRKDICRNAATYAVEALERRVLLSAAPDGQLWFINNGGPVDAVTGHLNSDGSNVTQAGAQLGTDQSLSVGIDLAAGLYFTISKDELTLQSRSISNPSVVLSSVQIGNPAGPGGLDNDIVYALAVDPFTHTAYVSLWGQDTAHTGIVKVDYNTSTGALDPNAAYGTGSVYDSNTPYLIQNQANFTSARDFFIDHNGGFIYFVDDDNQYNTAPFSPTNGIYRVSLSGAGPVEITSNANSTGGFPTNQSNGIIGPMAVDLGKGLIYFEANHIGDSHATLWYVSSSATGALATQVSVPALPSGAVLSFGDNPQGGISIDQQNHAIFITVQSGTGTETDPDEIVQGQLSADGHSVTSWVNTYPIATLDGHTPNANSHIADTAFDQLPTLTITGTPTHAAEQVATPIDLTSAATTITDVDGNHLSSATVQITAGTFVSNETSANDDHLTVNDGGVFKTSGTFTGTNITIAYDSANEKLTLSGYDTLSNYQTVVNAVSYNTTGDNPTNYGNNPTRTISWTASDGALNIPFGAQNSQSTTLTIDAANDAPVNHLPGSAPSGSEDTLFTLSGLSVTDADADPSNQNIQVTLGILHGTLAVSTSVAGGLTSGGISGNNSATVILTGTQNAINATLGNSNGLRYLGNLNYNGGDTLTITTDDQGHTPTPAQQDQDTLGITVNPLNDSPVLSGFGTPASSTEQTVALLNSAATVSDVDLDPLNGAAGSYTGASLTIARHLVANTQDSLGIDPTGATFTVSGANLQSGGQTFGTFSSSSGTLTVNFTSSQTTANTALVNDVMRHITYANQSDVPPVQVTLDYAFNDGSPSNGQGPAGGAATTTSSLTVNITAVNDPPSFTGLDSAPTYNAGATAAVLDNNATITDPELAAANNYNGATLTLARHGGANAQDIFSASGTLAFTAGNVNIGANTVGTFTSSGGTLAMTFNANATSTLVNSVLDQIAYSTLSNAPAAMVQIDFTVNDGNTGAQGTGGALSGTGSITVNVQTSADLGITVSGPGNATAGATAGFDYTLTVMNNGPSDNSGGFVVQDVLPTGTTYQSTGSTAGANVVGQTVTYTIGAGLVSSATSTFTVHVTLASSAAKGSTLQDSATVATSGTTDPNTTNNTSNTVNTTVLTSADLAITASGPTDANAGDPAGFNYTLVVTNNGPSDYPAAGVLAAGLSGGANPLVTSSSGGFTVDDVLPTGTTFQSTGSTSGATVNGQDIKYINSAALISGATQTYVIHVTVASNVSEGTVLHDHGTVTAGGGGVLLNSQQVIPNVGFVGTPDPNLTNNTSNTVDTTIHAGADLSISDAGPATVNAGAGFDYTLVVTNNGPLDNTGFTVTDTLPTGTTYQSAGSTSGAVVAGQMVTYTSTGLAGNATQTFVIHVTTPSTTTDGTILLDTGTVASTGTIDNNTTNDTSNQVSTTVQRPADLSISKSGPATTNAGDPNGFDYTFVVTNNGPFDNTGGFVVTDVLPASTTYQSTGSTSGADVNGQTIMYTNSTGLANGAMQTFVIHVTTPSSTSDGTVLADTATVATSGQTDPNATNDTSNEVDTTVSASADLEITKSGPAATVAGAAAGFDYTLTVTNNGPSDIPGGFFFPFSQVTPNVPFPFLFPGGFDVTDTLPDGLTFQTAGSTAGASVSGQTVTYTSTSGLISGGTQTFTIHVTTAANVAPGTVLHNNATVQSNPSGFFFPFGTVAPALPFPPFFPPVSDPNTANNTSNTVDTTVSAEADLTIAKTDGLTTAVPGTSVTYTVTLGNNGPSDAPGTLIADTLPANSSYTVAESGGATGATSGTGSISQTVNLTSGGGIVYTVIVPIPSSATGSFVNTATVTPASSVTDTNTTTSAIDSDTLTPTVDLTISKDDGQTSVVPGTNVTYTIIVGNTGPSDAPGVGISDTIPATITGVTFTEVEAGGATGAANGSGNSLSQSVNLPSGSSITYAVTGTVSSAATGSLVNTASLTVPSSVTDTDLTTSATDTDTLTPQADLAITKTDNQTTVVPGANVTYTIIVSNTGPSDAPGTIISDMVPTQLGSDSYTVAESGGATGATSGSGDISQTVNMPAGSSITYTVTGSVASSATGSLSNMATVAAGTSVTDGNSSNDSATDTDTLTPRVDLSITKDDHLTLLTPSTPTTTYTIVVANTGPSDAVGATVIDMLPPAISGGSWTATFGGSATGNSSGTGSISETVNLPSGTSITYLLTASITPGSTGSLVNTATISAATETDSNSNNNSATDTDMLGKAPSVIHASDLGGVYTGSPFPAMGYVAGIGGAKIGTPVFTYFLASDKTFSHPLAGVPTNVGNYAYKATFAGNSTYLPTSTSALFSITRGSAIIHTANLGGVYNGKAFAATGYVAGADGGSIGTPVFTYYLATDKSFSHPLAGAPPSPGNYAFKATFAGNSNYLPTFTTAPFSISIPVSSLKVLPIHVVVGATFNGTVGQFAAPAALAASLFTVTITWGDGTTSTGTVKAAATKGQLLITGTHKWTHAGPFMVTLTLLPAGSAALTATGSAS